MMMKKILLAITANLFLVAGFAQMQQAGTAAAVPLETYSDEFDNAAALGNWKQFHTTEAYPDKIRSIAVSEGILTLQPYASGWYGDYQAPFLYKTISGDFDVRARVKVSGTGSELPQSEWSLAGLMIRQAKMGTSSSWQPRQENWLFLTTGVAEPRGVAMFEVKTTNNSISNLKLRPARSGWVELRVVRVQASFILMYRYEGEPWTVLERFYRPLLPPQVQVGLNAYSGWNQVPGDVKKDPAQFNATLLKDVHTDLQFQVDYVRFRKPVLNNELLKALAASGFAAPYYIPANLLTDYSVSNERVLAILGD